MACSVNEELIHTSRDYQSRSISSVYKSNRHFGYISSPIPKAHYPDRDGFRSNPSAISLQRPDNIGDNHNSRTTSVSSGDITRQNSSMEGASTLDKGNITKGSFQRFHDGKIYSHQEYLSCQEKGLCFRCEEPYNPFHRCSNNSMCVTNLAEDDEGKVKDEVRVEQIEGEGR